MTCKCDTLTAKWRPEGRAALCEHLRECPESYLPGHAVDHRAAVSVAVGIMEHALLNSKSLTGGDERRMKRFIAEHKDKA